MIHVLELQSLILTNVSRFDECFAFWRSKASFLDAKHRKTITKSGGRAGSGRVGSGRAGPGRVGNFRPPNYRATSRQIHRANEPAGAAKQADSGGAKSLIFALKGGISAPRGSQRTLGESVKGSIFSSKIQFLRQKFNLCVKNCNFACKNQFFNKN